MSAAGRQGDLVLPPIQGEVYVDTLAAAGTSDIDLTSAANRPASAAADDEWWFAGWVSIHADGGDIEFALGAAGSAAIVPGAAGAGGFSDDYAVSIPNGGVASFRMPGASSGKTVLHLGSVAGARVQIWRSSQK